MSLGRKKALIEEAAPQADVIYENTIPRTDSQPWLIVCNYVLS
jgi:hypothetical protein